MATTPAPNGNPNSYFFSEVRRIIRDQPVYDNESIPTDGVNGVISSTGKPFRLRRAPIWVGGSVPVVSAPGGPWTAVFDTAPAAGQVEIVSDTGEVIFNSVPASGTMTITYQFVRYSDQELLDALTEGMRHMFPEIWQMQIDTSLAPSVVNWEYSLPAIFNDPRVELLRLEVRDPNIQILPYRDYDRWSRISLTTLQFFDLGAFSPAGNIRISYNAPYQALSDIEVGAEHLPIYFAAGRILADQESSRTRQDELVPLTGEGGSAPGVASNIGEYWMTLFERGKARLARPLPTRTMHEPPSWERLWRSA